MKIRTRIFLVFVILMAIGIFSLVRWMQGEMRPRYMEAQEDTLVDLSQLLASIVSSQGVDQEDGETTINTGFLHNSFEHLHNRNINAQIYQLHKQQVDIRVYVTNQLGKVIYDSDGERDLNADYSQWRDVYLTLRGQYGARSTDFDPLYPDGSIMYVAAPILFNDEVVGVVSVGKTTRNAERFMAHLLDNIATVGLIILAIAILVGLFVHGWLSRPLARLQTYAQAVTEGQRTSLPALGNNEVGEVGQAMESMRIALDGKSYVSDYVQALTHELKSPIAAIKGSSELLEEDMPAQARRQFLGNIAIEADRMQELIDRLLELASLEYRPSLELSDVVIANQLIADVVASMQAFADSREINMTLPDKSSIGLHGDYFLLSKALTNIIKNAIEFSQSKSEITISLFTDNNLASIRICDEGVGIPEYAREKVFERFFSLARPDGRKGSGLGLSFVKEIAALHHGLVEIKDNPESFNNTGTCITLKLPDASH